MFFIYPHTLSKYMEIITVYDCVVNFISPALLFFHRSHNTQDNGENPGDLFNLSRRVARIRPNFSGPSRLIDRLFRGEFSRMLMTRSYFHASPLFLSPLRRTISRQFASFVYFASSSSFWPCPRS